MNFMIVIYEILLALLLFIIMEVIKNKTKEDSLIYLFPNIYIILVASIFTSLKNYTLIILILYLLLDIINTYVLTQKESLIEDSIYFKNILITFIIGLIIYNFYLLPVDNAFFNINEFKNFIWMLVILYLYQLFKNSNIKDKKIIKNNYDKHFKEYVILNYAKFKNKYSYLIKVKNKDIENVLYSMLIYESLVNSGLNKYLKRIRNRINQVNIYGIMNVNSNHFITDEESIVIVKDKLVKKYHHLKKDSNTLELIKVKYQDKESIFEIKKILKIIEDFNKQFFMIE